MAVPYLLVSHLHTRLALDQRLATYAMSVPHTAERGASLAHVSTEHGRASARESRRERVCSLCQHWTETVRG
eukprot:1764540-Rhodomonas_salina.2